MIVLPVPEISVGRVAIHATMIADTMVTANGHVLEYASADITEPIYTRVMTDI